MEDRVSIDEMEFGKRVLVHALCFVVYSVKMFHVVIIMFCLFFSETAASTYYGCTVRLPARELNLILV